MAGDRYIVELDLRQVGNFNFERVAGSAGKAEAAVDRLKGGMRALSEHGNKFVSSMDWAARKIGGLAIGGALAAGAAGLGAMAYGVVNLNNELEKTTISLGAIFSANGLAKDLPAGMKIAQSTIKDMRKDAQQLPGEFEDLLNIFRTSAISATRAGSTVDEHRKLSAKVMAASAVADVPMDQAAREFAQLIEGRSGAHNVLGMRLMGLSGDKAEAFNKMSDTQRLATLNKELDKYSSSIATFGKSFEGVSSTLKDQLKTFGLQATSKLFDSVKDTLGDVNTWFNDNQVVVGHWADRIGVGLQDAFLWGKRKIEEWWPILSKFAVNAYDKLSAVWTQIQPAVERFGQFMKEALSDPGTIDKLLLLGKLYLGLKAGQMAWGAGSAVAGVGQGAWKIAGAIGGVGGKAAGAVASAADGLSVGGLTMGIASAGAAAVTAGAALLALGGVAAAVWQGMDLYDQIQKEHNLDVQAEIQYGKEQAAAALVKADAEGKAYDKVSQTLAYARDDFDKVGAVTRTLADEQRHYLVRVGDSMTITNELAYAHLDAAMAATQFTLAVEKAGDAVSKRNQDYAAEMLTGMTQNTTDDVKAFLSDEKKKEKAVKHSGGGGGTSIAKVEIVVTGNDNPSRVALKVFDELGKLGRNRTSSKHVPNYAVAGG